MGRIDGYDTPSRLAGLMVEAVGEGGLPYSVLDPAMGMGNLLRAAEKRWREQCIYFGCDIARSVVNAIRREYPDWLVGCCDFLVPRSRSSCHSIRRLPKRGADLILLNPPFSGRGAAVRLTSLGGEVVRSSTALSFVVASLRYLSSEGTVLALLPAGTVLSEKDENAWKLIRSMASVSVETSFKRGTFAGVFAETCLFRIGPKERCGAVERKNPVTMSEVSDPSTATEARVSLMRGNVCMHQVGKYESAIGVPLVHTTSLRDCEIMRSGPLVDGRARKVLGPAVLLPRVGFPKIDKISVLPKGESIAPSDCVLALQGPSDIVETAWVRIIEHLPSLQEAYGGSCAPYITIRRMAAWLGQKGIAVTFGDRERTMSGDEPWLGKG